MCFRVARRRKETLYPELVGDGGRARLVVLAGEVGGRFSEEIASFFRGLAAAKVRDIPVLLRGSMLACAAARAFASRSPFTDKDCCVGVDGLAPSVHEVLGDSRHFLCAREELRQRV